MPNDLTNYYAVQDKFQTGDYVEWAGNSLISKLIMRVTKLPASHSSMVVILPYEGKPRRHVIESVKGGPKFSLLSENLKYYNGTAYWYHLKKEYDPLRSQMAVWMINELAQFKKYDTKGLLVQLYRRASLDAEAWFCSEFYHYALIHVGILPDEGKGSKRPGEFSNLGIFDDFTRIL
jgi:hypothetical protein